MKKLLIALSLTAMAATASYADPYADRSAIMKAIGKAVGSVAPIAKGGAPFDATAVAAAFTEISTQAAKVDVTAMFPEGSNTGESTAAPKIWEDMAGFTAAMDKFKTEAAAAAGANPADLAAFQAEFGKLTKNCGACHETYRIKKG
jgi:cytochrome c556